MSTTLLAVVPLIDHAVCLPVFPLLQAAFYGKVRLIDNVDFKA